MCSYCHEILPLTREHLIPASLGGKFTIPVCERCNHERGTSPTYGRFIRYIIEHPSDWIQALGVCSKNKRLPGWLKKVNRARVEMWSTYR